jgi:hypothetical protein
MKNLLLLALLVFFCYACHKENGYDVNLTKALLALNFDCAAAIDTNAYMQCTVNGNEWCKNLSHVDYSLYINHRNFISMPVNGYGTTDTYLGDLIELQLRPAQDSSAQPWLSLSTRVGDRNATFSSLIDSLLSPQRYELLDIVPKNVDGTLDITIFKKIGLVSLYIPYYNAEDSAFTIKPMSTSTVKQPQGLGAFSIEQLDKRIEGDRIIYDLLVTFGFSVSFSDVEEEVLPEYRYKDYILEDGKIRATFSIPRDE